MNKINNRSLTELKVELECSSAILGSARVLARMARQVVSEGRLLELGYFALNRATPEALKHCKSAPASFRFRPVDQGYRWTWGPWKEDFANRLLVHDAPIADSAYFLPTRRGHVLQFGERGVTRWSCSNDGVSREILLNSPFAVRRHSVCERPSGLVIAGEYGRFAKRLLFICPDGTVQCHSPYGEIGGVRHFHLVTDWQNRVVLATGDAHKRLDYLHFAVDSNGHPHDLQLTSAKSRLGGFISAARHRDDLYLGSDFFLQENYLLKLTREGKTKRLFLPCSIRSLYIGRMEVFGMSKCYLALCCRSVAPLRKAAFVIFDPDQDTFISKPILTFNGITMPIPFTRDDYFYLCFGTQIVRIEIYETPPERLLH